MPYLQKGRYLFEDKQRLARKLCETYSGIMKVDVDRISIAIRELGDGGVWRTIDGELTPVSVLMCDIRRGLRTIDSRSPRRCAESASMFSN